VPRSRSRWLPGSRDRQAEFVSGRQPRLYGEPRRRNQPKTQEQAIAIVTVIVLQATPGWPWGFETAPNLTSHWKAKKTLLTGRKSPREKSAARWATVGGPNFTCFRAHRQAAGCRNPQDRAEGD
jgi:hypothetical protein